MGRLGEYRERVLEEVRAAFDGTDSPRTVASSFALGVFITMLPTLGVGVLVFVVLSYLFAWINKVALFASVVVLNPVVKWGVYAGSIAIGVFLLGPVEGVAAGEVGADAGGDLLLRLLVGNLILAAAATVVGYVAIHRMLVAYRERQLERLEPLVDGVLEDVDGDR